MKENDQFNIANDEYGDDAQAVQTSELLTIYNAMDCSEDIQPLENIRPPELIKTDYNHLVSDNLNSEKNKDTHKKRIPILSKLYRHRKRILISIITVVVLAGAATGLYFFLINIDKNDSKIQSVFQSDSETEIMLKNGKSYYIGKADHVNVTTDGAYVFFSVNTESKTGKYDIKIIDVSSKSSLEKSGSYIDSGVDDGWQVNSDGTYICYSKTASGTTKYYMYSLTKNKAELITNDLEELFMPQSGDIVYFTRRSGSTYSLHRARYGENSENIKSGIDYARKCSKNGKMEVIYTVKTGTENNVDVYIVSGADDPVTACTNVNEVYANEYECSGNLYYFIKNKSNVNWQDFVADEYYDSDATMEKPVEGDFMIEKGFIFKRYVLDSEAYNNAKIKYEAKLGRDKIREELNKLDLGLAVKDEYTCYVYNSATTQKLATGVVLDNIISYSLHGAPGIVFRKSAIDVNSKITMDKLSSIASSKSVLAAMDYVRNNVVNSYTVSNNCFYSWYDSNKVLEYTVKEYDASKTNFVFGDRNVMYAFSSGKLYYNGITESEISAGKLINSNVTSYAVADGYLYYYKTSGSALPSLYRFSPDKGTQTLCENVYSYLPIDENYVIILSGNSDNSKDSMSVGVFSADGYKVIDTDVSLTGFTHNGYAFGYLKNNNKELYVASLEDGTSKISDGVTDIYYIGE